MSSRIGMRIGAALFTLPLLGIATAASAHVTVSSPDAKAGGWGKLVFRVPTESETASTTSIKVTLPEKTPLARISNQPKAGWSAKLTTVKHDKPVKVGDFELTETVSAVTWTATGDGIKPGEFDEFALSVGPLPEAESLSFSVAQGYSDKTVANWNEIAKGDKEPEHPAPTLALVADEDHDHEAADKDDESDGDNGIALGLSAVAVVLAGVAVFVGLRNNRRNA